MPRLHHTEAFARTEDAMTVLFCLIDDAYALLNPRAASYEAIKRLSDSEVLTLALLQQLRGVESERSLLRDAQPVLLPPVPRGRGSSPLLVAPKGAYSTQALLGAAQARCA
jgi:hypothetical protein